MNTPDASYFNKLGYAMGQIRDKNIVATIGDAIAKHNKVLVVYGSYHHFVAKPVFEKMFGEKGEIVQLISDSKKPQKFYHGTQTAIHLLPDAYLDPKFAGGRDENDPKKPHVFVTPIKLLAKIFALKAGNVSGISISKNFPIIEFSSEPKNIKGGWVYSCTENPDKPFEEIIVRGQHTGKWVGFDKVPITEPEYVPGLEHLMRHDNLQVYILKDGIDLKEWSNKKKNLTFSGGGGLDSFYAEQVKAGNVRHLNAELLNKKTAIPVPRLMQRH